MPELLYMLTSGTLTVHHFKPSSRSIERGKHWEDYNYQEENLEVRSKGRQRGTYITLKPRIQELKYDVIHFGFTKLTSPGGLSPEVQRQLRNANLIEARVVKRKRA